MEIKNILVPTDFTPVAHTAIEHALDVASTIHGKVFLLNVVQSKEEVDEANKKLAKEMEYVKGLGSSVPVETFVRIGNIFDDIGDAAVEQKATLIIMGTHGASGWQKVTGSYALKVITNSTTPFVVVQDRVPEKKGYDKILVPLDLNNETKQKLEIVADMAKYFESDVILVTPKETDEFLAHKLNGNIAWAKKYLNERNIKNEAMIIEGNFVKNMLKKAYEMDVDLISIMNLQKNSLMGMFGSSYEQAIITNEFDIPVLCVNPKDTMSGGSVFSR